MRILSILAHPRRDSLCHALAEAANKSVRNLGHDLVFHDLYQEGFDPVLRPDEAFTTGDTVEQVLNKGTDPVLLSHRRDIAEANGLIVVHPNWWGKPPAILAGWLDRVLVPGVAYRLDTGEGEPVGLLSAGTALILNTSDTIPEREERDLGDPLEAIWKNCVLPYCGVTSVERHIFRPVAGSSVVKRKEWLGSIDQLVASCFGTA